MKNLLLFCITLFSSSVILAQLYVKPNSGNDTYIYVKDEVLFVEDNVTLTANPTSGEESSIYLRHGSQLIQGTGTTGNSGNGTISVFQNTPDSDAYDYTYWCAPVGNPAGTGNRWFGMARMNDSIADITSNLANTTPAHNGSISPMTISTRWLYIKPRGFEAYNDYIKFSIYNAVPSGMGFTMKGLGIGNHDQWYDFRGRANNGDIVVTIFPDGEYTLAGNPYPSALDLNRLFWDPANVDIQQFFYWDEDHDIDGHNYTQNRGGYGTYVPGLSDPNGTTDNGIYTEPMFKEWEFGGGNPGGTGSTGQTYKRRFAPIGQGIMFVGEDSGAGFDDGQVYIRNAHRRYIKEGNDSDFRRPAPGGGTSTVNAATDPSTVIVEDTRMPQIRINNKFGESHMRQIVLAFLDESTDGYDRGLDGRSPMDATSEAYFPVAVGTDTNMKPFVISTVPFQTAKKVPISFELDQQHKIEIKAVEEVNLPTNNVYLYDSLNNTNTKITGGNSATIILNQGTYTDRFYIVFRGSAITPGGNTGGRPVATNMNFFQNNSVGQLEVNNPDGHNIKNAYVFDMTGKAVISRNNIGTEHDFTFGTSSLSDGVYLVKLVTDENIEIDYKITVHNKG